MAVIVHVSNPSALLGAIRSEVANGKIQILDMIVGQRESMLPTNKLRQGLG